MIQWPATLPPLDRISGGSVQPVSNALPIETEVGEPMTRQRFTGEMDDITMSILLSGSQRIVLYEFYRRDLKGGSLRFSHDHPLTLEATELMFMAAPRFTPLGNDLWRADLSLRSIS
jgi:hypothetical protein